MNRFEIYFFDNNFLLISTQQYKQSFNLSEKL